MIFPHKLIAQLISTNCLATSQVNLFINVNKKFVNSRLILSLVVK